MCLERSIADITIKDKKNVIPPVDRRQRKIVKPKFPRKITSSCIINLNKFWNELEDFYINRTSSKVITFSNEDSTNEEMENSINENIEKSQRLSSLERFVYPSPYHNPQTGS